MVFPLGLALILLGTGLAAAQSPAPQRSKAADVGGVRVELGAPVPPVDPMQTEVVLPPSACRLRLSADVAQAPSIPPRAGPGACGGEDLVRLEAVVLPDNSRVALQPPAVLRCSMAETLVDWVRKEVPAIAGEVGTAVQALENFSSYDCRSRNNVAGTKLSEHGLANAFDLRGLKLTDGRRVDFTDVSLDRGLRERVRAGVCTRFNTVLGPGSDRYHESHVHLDLAQRSGGYRMCQWDVREAPQIASVPLPLPRPKLIDPQVVDANGVPLVLATLRTAMPEGFKERLDPGATSAAAPRADRRIPLSTDSNGNAGVRRTSSVPPVASAAAPGRLGDRPRPAPAGKVAVAGAAPTDSAGNLASRGKGQGSFAAAVDANGNPNARAKPERRLPDVPGELISAATGNAPQPRPRRSRGSGG